MHHMLLLALAWDGVAPCRLEQSFPVDRFPSAGLSSSPRRVVTSATGTTDTAANDDTVHCTVLQGGAQISFPLALCAGSRCQTRPRSDRWQEADERRTCQRESATHFAFKADSDDESSPPHRQQQPAQSLRLPTDRALLQRYRLWPPRGYAMQGLRKAL